MKKIICALLASAMIITSFAACGKSTSPTNSDSIASTTADTTPAAQEDIDALKAKLAEGEQTFNDISELLKDNTDFAEYVTDMKTVVENWKNDVEKAVTKGTKNIVASALTYANAQAESLKSDYDKLKAAFTS